jgi:hypothetical protein
VSVLSLYENRPWLWLWFSYDAVGFGAVILGPLAITDVGPCTQFLAKLSFLFSCLLFNKLIPRCPCRLAGLFYRGHNLMLFDSVDSVGTHKDSWSASPTAVHISDRHITRRNSLILVICWIFVGAFTVRRTLSINTLSRFRRVKTVYNGLLNLRQNLDSERKSFTEVNQPPIACRGSRVECSNESKEKRVNELMLYKVDRRVYNAS